MFSLLPGPDHKARLWWGCYGAARHSSWAQLPLSTLPPPFCTDASEEAAALCQGRTSELSALVNEFILRRTNTLLSQHLPPKARGAPGRRGMAGKLGAPDPLQPAQEVAPLGGVCQAYQRRSSSVSPLTVLTAPPPRHNPTPRPTHPASLPQVVEIVCCRLTPLQTALYCHFLESKATATLFATQKAARVLSAITSLRKLLNHPKLIWDALQGRCAANPRPSLLPARVLGPQLMHSMCSALLQPGPASGCHILHVCVCRRCVALPVAP